MPEGTVKAIADHGEIEEYVTGPMAATPKVHVAIREGRRRYRRVSGDIAGRGRQIVYQILE